MSKLTVQVLQCIQPHELCPSHLPTPFSSFVLAGEALVCSHTLLLTVGNARCLHCSLAQETVQNGAYMDLIGKESTAGMSVTEQLSQFKQYELLIIAARSDTYMNTYST